MSDQPDAPPAVNSADNSGERPKSAATGRPFTKNDPRIWRKGRPRVPKSSKQLEALLREIAAEELSNPNTGESVQRIRAMLRAMFTSKNPADKKEVLDRMFGKVPQPIDVTSGGKPIKGYAIVSPDDWNTDDKPPPTD